MSYEDAVKTLKIVSTVSLGQFAGASVYAALSVQPSLIEQHDVTTSSKIMRSILRKSSMMPICALINSASSIALYYKTRGTAREDSYWLLSGGLMLCIFPYTVSLIGPINVQFNEERDFTSDEDKWSGLLTDWLTFHYPRAALSLTLFAVGVYKLTCSK